MVTGASGLLGRAIVRSLVQRDEVRATVRRADAADELRSLGAKVAVRSLEEPGDVRELLGRVHTLVHLVGGVNQPDDDAILRANHGSTLAAVAAAKDAGVKRVILVSVPGADPEARHPFLRAKGLAEEVVVHSGLEHAVLRCAHAYGLGGLWFTATVVAAEAGFVVGGGEQRLAPLLADDVGRAVAAIDDRRDRVAGTWHLEGPDVLTADELHALLDGRREPEHVAPPEAARRLTTLLERPVAEAATELFAGGTPAPDDAAADAALELDVDRTRLEDGLRRTARLAEEVADRVRRDA
jgi:uncharacterized protein YbjT (DUF2867 family)